MKKLFSAASLLLIACYSNDVCGKSATQCSDYPQRCSEAARDNKKFMEWRKSPACIKIVETVSYKQGLALEKIIKSSYPNLLPFCEKICLEDKIGSPISCKYSIGSCSPTILRYLKVAGDLQKEFGDLTKLNIIEIGGGFGGQCKILNDVAGFASYSIIDLPECMPYIDRYLKYFGVKNFSVIDCTKISQPMQFDLVISNYAISEIDKHGQLNYIKNIVNLAPMGYIIYNYSISNPFVNSYTLQEFVACLSTDKRLIKIEPETPQTAKTHDNFVIIWRSK